MDMNTVYGGLAAALVEDPLWVMNVVSSYAPNTLPWSSIGVSLALSMIGKCEAFSTYPRTYDLLHVDGLFTTESHSLSVDEADGQAGPKGLKKLGESSFDIENT
ncbi:putative S-adenosyl-L-methionine-dependent methyltransferase [Helianthus annuus]|nr:putative S-adenosyl-L-methionine-dependent methyltransferase [Helianthus annuus]